MSVPGRASTAEAMDMVLAGLRHLAAADPAALAARAQAECLQAFEQADAICTAARAWFLGAFTAARGYSQDADYSPAAWLIHRTRITRGHLGWARRVQAHPQVAAALATGTAVTESIARTINGWTDKLPRESRPADDEIPDRRGGGPDGPAGPGQPGRRDLCPVPPRRPPRRRSGPGALLTRIQGAAGRVARSEGRS